MAASSVVETIAFGQHNVRASQIFFRSSLSYGLVNLMPLVPGHVLVISQRRVARFRDLTPPEVSDLWTSAQRIGEVVERHYKGDALTMAIQDGAAAGQTVSHVHIHVIPRRRGDFERNDEVYERLDMDKDRTKRTEEEMAEEAALLARYFDDGNTNNAEGTSPLVDNKP